MMRILEIAMRLVCFVIGIMLAFGMTVRIHDGDTREVLANMIFVLVWNCAVLALLILPWALPLRN